MKGAARLIWTIPSGRLLQKEKGKRDNPASRRHSFPRGL